MIIIFNCKTIKHGLDTVKIYETRPVCHARSRHLQ